MAAQVPGYEKLFGEIVWHHRNTYLFIISQSVGLIMVKEKFLRIVDRWQIYSSNSATSAG